MSDLPMVNASVLSTLPAELQRIARELEGEGLLKITNDQQQPTPGAKL